MEKVKIILDTDLGSDWDDAGALAVLHNLANEGKADILAVTHCGSEISGCVTIKMINEWYNRPGISVGRYDKKAFLEEERCTHYTRPLMEKYLKNNEKPEFENSVRVLRRSLANNKNVTIAVIGMLNNIAELLKSQSDDISPLSGVQLVEKSVENMYVMGGNFVDPLYCEYNIKTDSDSAVFVSENFPKPIIYCGFELGESIETGEALADVSVESPVRYAYIRGHEENGPIGRSWDPITVYCAVNNENTFYEKSDYKTISFDCRGRTLYRNGGKDCYLKAIASNDEVKNEINRYLK